MAGLRKNDNRFVSTTTYVDPVTGETKKYWAYAKTKDEADRKIEQFEARIQAGLDARKAGYTVAQWIDEWLPTILAPVRPHTAEQYETMLRRVQASKLGAKKLTEVLPMDIQRFVSNINGVSKGYIDKMTFLLKRAFTAAVHNKLLTVSPYVAVKKPKAPEGHHEYLEDGVQDLITSTWREHRFGPCAMLMLHTGMRRGEMLAFDCDQHIDWKRKMLLVERAWHVVEGGNRGAYDEPKKASFGEIPLQPELEEVLQDRHGLLFRTVRGGDTTISAYRKAESSYKTFIETKANGISKMALKQSIRRLKQEEAKGKRIDELKLKRLEEKLENWKELNWRSHDNRVTFATDACERGVSEISVRGWLRQRDPKMLQLIYKRQSNAAKQADIDKLNARASE